MLCHPYDTPTFKTNVLCLVSNEAGLGEAKIFWSGKFQGQIYVYDLLRVQCSQVGSHYMFLFYIGMAISYNEFYRTGGSMIIIRGYGDKSKENWIIM